MSRDPEHALDPPRHAATAVVGRAVELDAVQSALERARDGVFAVGLSGEPGIGKTHLLLAVADRAVAAGFVPIRVTADEEIRGPFLLARSIFTGAAVREGATPAVEDAAERARITLSGGDPAIAGLPPDQRMLRALDEAAMALRAISLQRPVALLVDDVHWADTDSLRLLRYLVRNEPSLPVLIVLAMRSEEAASASELVNLLADLERMSLVRRLQLARFRQSETAEFLRRTLGGEVDATSAAALHAQAEGVPLFALELVRGYRDAGLLQRIDTVWRLDPKAVRLLPSGIRTLIQRRAAHLGAEAKEALSEAAVLGRSFRLADLIAVRARLDEPEGTAASLADLFAPAVGAGLLREVHDASGADYRFAHEHVREFCLGLLSAPRRRAVHGAIVDILTGDGDPPVAELPVLARHALAAGDTERSIRFSVGAVAAALAANAPEEALRLVEETLPIVATRAERVALLRARDDALDMLCRQADRLQGLAELSALAEAASDTSLELETTLRRAAAFRLADQDDRAAQLAADVRRRAAAADDRAHELAACLELGQDLLHMAIGEGYSPTPSEADLDGAAEAYERATVIAEEIGDDRGLAASLRERGAIGLARLRAWFIDAVERGEHVAVMARVAAGEPLDAIVADLPIVPLYMETGEYLTRALEVYEQLGDRRGAMSTIIALAYHRDTAEVHLGRNPVGAIEEIRRLASEMRSFGQPSERTAAQAQMVYGVHVFARAKVIPDLAVSRGAEAWEHARSIGDRGLEYLAAGGTAMACLDLGEIDEGSRWLDRAAGAAAESPTPLRARQVETWRAQLAAARRDAAALRLHLDRAADLAASGGRPAGRCETLATLALEAARLGSDVDDPELVALADATAVEARRLAAGLPGRPLWGAQADAACAIVALARDDDVAALAFGRAALDALRAARREDPHLEIMLPSARTILAAGSAEERAAIGAELQLLRSLIAQRTMDEERRVAWFRGPVGRELSALSEALGPVPAGGVVADPRSRPGEDDLLRLLVDGRTNDEIAAELGVGEPAVERMLAEMYARLGVSSRSEATALALRDGSAS